jgi:hypothetical protein
MKRTQYDSGRLDGLRLGLDIAKHDGIEALEKECKMRGAWGIHTALAAREVDKATEQIKTISFQTLLVAWLSVLHDTFGFGQIRCQRAVDAFTKLTAYLDHGWLYWFDLITELEEKLNLTINTSALTQDSMGRTYRHPEPEDIYTETDYVDENAWKQTLRTLHFTEQDDKDGTWILDEHGEKFIHFSGNFGKIQAYDTLYGIELAIDHWGIKP